MDKGLKILNTKIEAERRLLDATFELNNQECIDFEMWHANKMVGLNYEEMNELRIHLNKIRRIHVEIHRTLKESYAEIEKAFEVLNDILCVNTVEGTRLVPLGTSSANGLVYTNEVWINSLVLSLITDAIEYNNAQLMNRIEGMREMNRDKLKELDIVKRL